MDARIEEKINEFHATKPEGDIDLVGEVRKLLVESGLGQNLHETYDINRFIVDAKNKHSNAQRYLLNRYWYLQLSKFQTATINERGSLIPNGSVHTWLKIFQEVILPKLIELRLPVII